MTTDLHTGAVGLLLDSVNSCIRGKPKVVELGLICMLAEGHLLLEDVPGTGKTSLARALAGACGLPWRRIQFTPDVMPGDVTGVSVFHPRDGSFAFHPGPVFTSVVLADEINRASPRTQASLLEAMEERTVSVDGTTHDLPSPFMVIATQNPVEMAGTYPLPEAQLDRFLMRTSVGYPALESEVAVVRDHHDGRSVADIACALDGIEVRDLIRAAAAVAIADEIFDYIVRLVAATRADSRVALGASPRGSVGLLRASRARAFVHGRDYVVPGDVMAMALPVLGHRLVMDLDAVARGIDGRDVIADLVMMTPAPQGA